MTARALTLERLLTHRSGFGLESASPLQRAICRLVDGVPLGELADAPGVLDAFGVRSAGEIPLTTSELLILSAIRCGKSLLAAALAVHASQTVDVSGLGAGDSEIPRVSVLSLRLDLADVVFRHIVGNLQARPMLRALMVGEPTADAVMLRHPSGRPIEIKCVAGARAGSTLVARWSAGVVFDEAPRMNGSEDGVVNFDDARGAVLGRMLPGARIVSIGSPWAPLGPVYDMQLEHFGKPTSELVVVRAPGPVMNPVYWHPLRVAALRAKDPGVARTDIDAEFADPETALITSTELAACTRGAPLELQPDQGLRYVAAIDPATRGNGWTLVIGGVLRDPLQRRRYVVALARQWLGSRATPLSPEAVLAEVAALCRRYRVTTVHSDQFSADALRDLARRAGLTLLSEATTAASKLAMFEDLRTVIATASLEIPSDPVLRSDLLSLRRRLTQSSVSIVTPRSSDGRHADYAPAIATLVAKLKRQGTGIHARTDATERGTGDGDPYLLGLLHAADAQHAAGLDGWCATSARKCM